MNANLKGGFIIAGVSVAVALVGFVLYCVFGIGFVPTVDGEIDQAPDERDSMTRQQARKANDGNPETIDEVL